MNKIFLCLKIIFISHLSLYADEKWIEGTSQPRERITISSPVDEVVEEVLVEEGDNVSKGDVLAKLLSKKQELAAKKLDNLISKAKFEYEAVKDLYEKKIESRANYLEKKAILGGFEVDKLMAENDVSDRLIKSPSDGVIVYRLIDPGESAEKVKALFDTTTRKHRYADFIPEIIVPITYSLPVGGSYCVYYSHYSPLGPLVRC